MTGEITGARVADLLESSGLFDGVAPELSRELHRLAEVVHLAAGERLLTQGQGNDRLFILLDGRVAIHVDGEHVARLDRRGDLLGEMSVITGQPCSATVVAEAPSVAIAIPAAAGGDVALQGVMHRIFARVLVDKLMATNEKAKQFERANSDLVAAHEALTEANLHLERRIEERTADLRQQTRELETQNAELSASQRKLEEVFLKKDKTLEKLGEICTHDLVPLRDAVLELRETVADPGLVGLSERVERGVTGLLASLEPLTELHASEVAMRDKRVLLAESDKKLQRIAKIALLGTGVKLDISEDVERCRVLCAENAYDVICTDVAHVDAALLAQERNPSCSIIFMTTEGVPAYLALLRQHPAVSNIVSCDLDDRALTVKNILTTVSKIVNQDIFGLEKYLTWGVEVETRTVRRSDQRRAIGEDMARHLRGLSVPNRVVASAVQVGEELLMNAIYDAPTDRDGAPLFNHLPRTTVVELPGADQATLRFACDGIFVAVSVEDPYGALDRSTILDYLDSCYGGRAGTLNTTGTKGGAGRGLFLINELSDLVIFNVMERRRTEVIALFVLDRSQLSAFAQPSFHFFIQRPPRSPRRTELLRR